MTNEEQMQVLKEAIKSNYKGSLAELLQPQQEPQGPEGVDMQQQIPEMPVPPASPPRINPASVQPPVQDNQGHLVQSYQSAPPGLRNLPSGPAEGMLIQKMETGGTKDPNPREYSLENVEQPTGEDEEAVVSKRTFDAFKNLDVVKDSYNVDRFYDYSNANPEEYVEYDGKLVDKNQLERYLTEDYGDATMDGKPLRQYLLDGMLDYRNLDREEFIGKDVISRYEDFKDSQNTDYRYESGKQDLNAPLFKAMDKILPKLDTLTDAEIQEFTRLINTLSSPYTEAMSKDENFGATDALKMLATQDLSGIKKYREKMGLSKEDVLDLIQPPEDANKFVKGLTGLTKKTLKLFVDFKDGGPRRTDGPRVTPSKESNEGMTGMMKAKIAMENEFGNNPAISRMIKPTDKSYDFGDGRTGTHHMGSYGKSAIPKIQDVGGSLQYTGPRMDEAIKFDRVEDATYFAENYKDVAPALRKKGGYKYSNGGTLQFFASSPLEKLKTASQYAAETVSDPVRKKIADNLYPLSYQGGVSRIINAVRGKREERDERTGTKEDPKWLQERTDLLQLHMGQDQKYNSVPKSKYKPSKAKDDDVIYYTSPSTEEIIRNNVDFLSEYDNFYTNKDSKKMGTDMGSVLGRYTLSKGEDEKGRYVAYYDKWDFNPFDYLPLGKTQKNLKKAYEKTLGFFGMDAPEVYGRVYYDEKGKTIKQKGGYRSKYGKDPVTGTGKKPKGSGRRLYTDENPKDTVGIKFATPADARATVAKVKKVNKPFARKIQILTVGEQRAKVMGKSQVSSIFTRGKEALRRGKKRT